MNLLEVQDSIKRLPDSDLNVLANQPGSHQFLAYGELADRQRLRKAYGAAQAGTPPTVAERLSQGASNPMPQPAANGLASLVAQQNAPLAMADGGLARRAVPVDLVDTGSSLPVKGLDGRMPAPAQGDGIPAIVPRQTDTVTVTAPKDPPPIDLNLESWMDGFIPAKKEVGIYYDQLKEAVKANAPPDRVTAEIEKLEEMKKRDLKEFTRDKWMALAEAGFAAAGATGPNFLANITTGAQAGLGALGRANERRTATEDKRTARGDMLEGRRSARELTDAEMLNRIATAQTNAEVGLIQEAVRGAAGQFNREQTQQFQSGENALERASRERIARANVAADYARMGVSERIAAQDRALRRELAVAEGEVAKARAFNEYLGTLSKQVADGDLTASAAAELGQSFASEIGLAASAGGSGISAAPPAAPMVATAQRDPTRFARQLSERERKQIGVRVANGADLATFPAGPKRDYAQYLLDQAAAASGRQ